MQLPELEPTQFGTYATDVRGTQIEAMNRHEIHHNIGNGDAIPYATDVAEEVAHALLAAVRCARNL